MKKHKKYPVKKRQKKTLPIHNNKLLNFDIYFLFFSTIIIIPFIFSTKTLDLNAAPRLLALAVIVGMFSILNFIKPVEGRPSFQFIKLFFFPVSALYLIWSILTLIPAVNPGEGVFDITKTFLTIALLVFFVQLLITHQNGVELLIKSVIVGAVVATAIGLVQYFDKVPGKSGYDLYMALYEVKGLMSNKNQFAISLMLMLPFVMYGLFTLSKLWRLAAAYSGLMIILNIVLIQTRSVWIGTITFFIGFLLLGGVFLLKKSIKNLLIQKRKVLTTLIVAFILIIGATIIIVKSSGTSSLIKYQVSSTFSTKSNNAQWRLKMWGASWQLAQDNLAFGVGAGNWKNAILPYYHHNFGNEYQNWRRPHNDFLWVLTEKGVIGLFLFMLIFGVVFYYGFKLLFSEHDFNKKLIIVLMLSGIGAYVVVSLFTFPLERINQQVYLSLIMAVIISYYAKGKAKQERKAGKLYLICNLVIFVLSVFSLYYANSYLQSELDINKIVSSMNAGNQRRVIKYADMAYSKLTSVDANNIPIKMYRGVANLHLKNYTEAYNDLQIALKDFPNQIAVLNNLAIVSSELNKNDEAISYLDKSLAIFPHYEESLSNKVIVYYRNKEYKKAYIALLNQSTRKQDKQYKRFKVGLEKLINK